MRAPQVPGARHLDSWAAEGGSPPGLAAGPAPGRDPAAPGLDGGEDADAAEGGRAGRLRVLRPGAAGRSGPRPPWWARVGAKWLSPALEGGGAAAPALVQVDQHPSLHAQLHSLRLALQEACDPCAGAHVACQVGHRQRDRSEGECRVHPIVGHCRPFIRAAALRVAGVRPAPLAREAQLFADARSGLDTGPADEAVREVLQEAAGSGLLRVRARRLLQDRSWSSIAVRAGPW